MSDYPISEIITDAEQTKVILIPVVFDSTFTAKLKDLNTLDLDATNLFAHIRRCKPDLVEYAQYKFKLIATDYFAQQGFTLESLIKKNREDILKFLTDNNYDISLLSKMENNTNKPSKLTFVLHYDKRAFKITYCDLWVNVLQKYMKARTPLGQ